MRFRPVVVAVTVIGLASLVAACSDFDMDKLDVFHLNEKKKLPGTREELFPGGVPGVSNGVPPELVKGYKPQEEALAPSPDEPKPSVAEEPKAKPKPKVVRRAPARKPTQVTVQPKKQQPAQQQAQDPAWQNAPASQPAAQSQWPASQPAQTGTNAPWPSAPQQPSAWPTAPAPGTFQKQ
jgi:type IV secretory pathway VirB10-like protein